MKKLVSLFSLLFSAIIFAGSTNVGGAPEVPVDQYQIALILIAVAIAGIAFYAFKRQTNKA